MQTDKYNTCNVWYYKKKTNSICWCEKCINDQKMLQAADEVSLGEQKCRKLSFFKFTLLTFTTSSSVEWHFTTSETSVTEASVPMVTTFTGTATVFPVRTAVFRISVSYEEKRQHRSKKMVSKNWSADTNQ